MSNREIVNAVRVTTKIWIVQSSLHLYSLIHTGFTRNQRGCGLMWQKNLLWTPNTPAKRQLLVRDSSSLLTCHLTLVLPAKPIFEEPLAHM
jgi:hypothetical protein